MALDGKFIDPGTMPADRLKSNAGIVRAQLAQVPDQRIPITPFDWRVWDSGALLGAPATDDLGIVAGTFGTDVFTVQAGDLKAAGATTRYAVVQVALPDYYEDGQTVTVRLRAGMKTTVADGTCTIDVAVHKVGNDGTASADLSTLVAATSINSLTEADIDFTVDAPTLVGGDVLEIRVAIACTDTATATAVIPVLYNAALLFDARG